MKRNFKRTISVFILTIMILTLIPAVSFAAEGDTPYTDFTYEISGSTIVLGKYNGTSKTVVIPKNYVINGITYQTVINSLVIFYKNTSITSVTLKSGVKFRDNKMNQLFFGCTSLTNVDISQISTKGIVGMRLTFYNCPLLTSLDLSHFDTSSVTTLYAIFDSSTNLVVTGYEDWNTSNVTDIAYLFNANKKMTTIDISKWDLSKVTTTLSAFSNTTATNILLPDNLPIISAFTFNHATGYNKSSFTIPSGVKNIGYAHTIYDFGTNSFNEFKIAESNAYYKVVDGILYSKDGTELIAVPRGKTFPDKIYEIPEGVTFIPELSFSRNQNISTIILPDSYVIRQNLVDYDSEYQISGDGYDKGNYNEGNSLSIALYQFTSVANYEVKESNQRYESDKGIIYSEDMTKLLAIPLKYGKEINIPDGVKVWENNAMYFDGRAKAPKITSIIIPASMTYIGVNQLSIINYLKKTYNCSINIAKDNPVYKLDADGYIAQYGISEYDISLSHESYAYDGTEKKPTVTVTASSGTTDVATKTLTSGTDYTVEYINNINVGIAQVKITGKGSYSGTVVKNFYIESATPYTNFTYKLDSSAKTITLTKYNGTATTVVVPGTYTVSGTLYSTVIDSETTFKSNSTIKSVTLCNGVKFKNNSMKYLFTNCPALEEIKLSRLDTSDITSMYAAFNGCTSLKNLDLSNFDTSKVTTFYAIFSNSVNINIKGIENWDTRVATTMAYMFYRVAGTPEINLNAWNLRNVTDTTNMFSLCEASNVILPNSLSLLPVENKISTVPSYEVSKENIYYSSDKGIIYNDDLSGIVLIPYKYNKDIIIPEGVKSWNSNAFNIEQKAESTTSHKIIIPASMTYIENNQIALINYLKGTKSWKIEVDKNNPVFMVDANGYLVQKGISDLRVALSEISFEYDGTEKKPTVTVTATTGTTTISQKTLTNGTDYTVEYLDNVNAGTAKVKITGKGSYSGIVYKPFTITSSTTPAKQFKYTKTNNDIAVELPTSLVSGVKDMEKIQIIVAYYDKETNAFLRMQKKTVRALTGDIIESFKLENEGEYAKIYVWNGDVSEVIPAYTYLTIE